MVLAEGTQASVDSIENAFKRSAGIAFSPRGRVYQISYAVEAAKNSLGVLFLKTQKGLVVFKSKDLLAEYPFIGTSNKEAFLQDSFFDPLNKVFVYFMGHKHTMHHVSASLAIALKNRANYVGPNFPGVNGYLKSVLMTINAQDIYKHKLSGLTSLVFTNDSLCKINSAIVRPNNKCTESSVIFEGTFSHQQVVDIINFLNSKKAFSKPYNENEIFDSSFYLKDLEALKEFKECYGTIEVYLINFQKGTIEQFN